MSACVQLDANNQLIADTTPPEECTGYILLDSTTWNEFQPVHWTMEEANELIALTVLIWGTAWIFRLVIDFLLNRR